MGTKLVRVNLADALHRRVKTVAAFYDKKIEDYIAEILDEHVPREITFPIDESLPQQKPKSGKGVH
jgi:plasmid stability protein